MDRADEILSRISALEATMNQRLDNLATATNQRFDSMNHRFDSLSSTVHNLATATQKGFAGLEAAITDMCEKLLPDSQAEEVSSNFDSSSEPARAAKGR